MFQWFFELDRILRGEATRPEDLQRAEIKIPIFGIVFVIAILGILYGFCMGVFALARGIENDILANTWMQCIASMVKVPLLFFLTLLVTFPSLYVFNALVGSKLAINSLLKLLLASLGVNMAVLASLGPIVIFFTVSTPDYSFIVLLNVGVFAFSGALGLAFLLQTLNRLTQSGRYRAGELPPVVAAEVTYPNEPAGDSNEPSGTDAGEAGDTGQSGEAGLPSESQSTPPTGPGPLDTLGGLGKHVRLVFACWMIVFGLVGSQMGWVLRPFIGNPYQDFQWFRTRESNFFESVMKTLQDLLMG